VPGSEFTVTVFSGPSLGTVFSAGGDRFMGVFQPGTYQVQISAEDAVGNFRDEDFQITVLQGDPPPTNLICNSVVNATLNGDCQRFITADMVLEGDFGCAQESDFQVNIVNDDDPTNGNILDGCGQFIYEVTYNGPLISGPNQGGSGGGGGGGAVTTGFTGAFAPANWTITEPPPSGVGGASGLGDVTFSATNLLITSGVDAGAVVSITLPANGILS
ncbi:MAG: hypothetical protein KDD09_26155, partial [Phaeodactylibacter sp.]|nr:hypothetical protein [Phaeodactylibacter sp.]